MAARSRAGALPATRYQLPTPAGQDPGCPPFTHLGQHGLARRPHHRPVRLLDPNSVGHTGMQGLGLLYTVEPGDATASTYAQYRRPSGMQSGRLWYGTR